ncbi:MAG: helix-turn-helix domain-containing protein [Pseudonocardiaceae bacterium]
MTTVQHWIGAQTKALRQAMRLSIRAFAAHLGVDTRTVNKGEARGATIPCSPTTKHFMDTWPASRADSLAPLPRNDGTELLATAH